MRKPEEMQTELREIGWYSLGYDGVLFTYVKDLKDVTKNMTRGAIRAEIDIYGECVRFIPCYKNKYDFTDIKAMFYCANQFMAIANLYAYNWVEEQND